MQLDQWLLAHGEVAQYVAYFTCLGVMGAFEAGFPARRAPRRRWRTNFALTLLNVAVLGALPISFVVAAQWADSAQLGLMNAVALPFPAELALGLLGRGFISWLSHLLMHKVPSFWRVHRVHHTDTELDVSTTVRFHPLEFPLGLALGLPLVVALGLPAWVLLAYECLDVCVTVFSHANVELPPRMERLLRLVVVTPGLHRIHHSTRVDEADSNFSAVFPLWDAVFGTLRTTAREAPTSMPLGLDELRDDRGVSLTWLLALPFRREIARPSTGADALSEGTP